MMSRGGELVGYVDQPAGTPGGDADASRLRDAGVAAFCHEEDLTRRPVWRAMIEASHEGDVLVVVALDRLGRPMRRLLYAVAHLCNSRIGLRCLDGDVELCASPQGRAQAQVFEALTICLATWEAGRARHRGKTMADRGRRPGAQPKLGANSAEDLRVMLQRPGASQTSVARELGIGRTTLYRYLKRTSAPRPNT